MKLLLRLDSKKKSDLADAVAEHGLREGDARKIVDGHFSSVGDAASKAKRSR